MGQGVPVRGTKSMEPPEFEDDFDLNALNACHNDSIGLDNLSDGGYGSQEPPSPVDDIENPLISSQISQISHASNDSQFQEGDGFLNDEFRTDDENAVAEVTKGIAFVI